MQLLEKMNVEHRTSNIECSMEKEGRGEFNRPNGELVGEGFIPSRTQSGIYHAPEKDLNPRFPSSGGG
jgi:hypothetical protein